MKQFLSTHEDFIRDTIFIEGVRDTQGRARDIFAVMIGLGRNIQHYGSDGGRPNAEICFDPSLGFNLGALTVRAKNKNLSGISGGKEIFINRGVDNAEAGGRQFTGPMDSFLQKFSHQTFEPEVADAKADEVPVTAEVEMSTAQEPSGPGAAQDEPTWKLEVEDPPLLVTLDGFKLMIENTSGKNKRVPKNLNLAQWVDGEVRRNSQK